MDSEEEYITELVLAEPVPLPAEGVTKQGQVEIKDSKKALAMGKPKWKVRWVILIKGSLHLFKNYEKTEAYQTINLKDAEVIDYQGEGGREATFGVQIKGTSSDQPKWFTGTTAEMNVWREVITNARSQEPSAPPQRATIPRSKRTSSPLFRAKKSVAGRAATTKMGKTVLRRMFGEEVQHLLETIKKISTKHANKTTANRVEKILIRLLIKMAFQFEKKNLTVETLVSVERPLREAMELLSKHYNTRVRRYTRRNGDMQSFVRVEALAGQAKEELYVKMQPYLTPKNLSNLRFLFDTLSNAKFLSDVFNDPDLPDELDEIDDAITAYTQFHF